NELDADVEVGVRQGNRGGRPSLRGTEQHRAPVHADARLEGVDVRREELVDLARAVEGREEPAVPHRELRDRAALPARAHAVLSSFSTPSLRSMSAMTFIYRMCASYGDS